MWNSEPIRERFNNKDNYVIAYIDVCTWWWTRWAQYNHLFLQIHDNEINNIHSWNINAAFRALTIKLQIPRRVWHIKYWIFFSRVFNNNDSNQSLSKFEYIIIKYLNILRKISIKTFLVIFLKVKKKRHLQVASNSLDFMNVDFYR